MALTTEQEQLLKETYYNPKTTGSIKHVFEQVRTYGIKYIDVKQFISKQETSQLFKKQPKIKHYYPIMAEYKNEKLQIDIMDLSDISTTNKGYKYLLIAVDVYSRMAYAIPLKNKTTDIVFEAVKTIVDETKPSIIISDLGSEFINRKYKQLMKDNNIEIRYTQVGDHKGLAIVNRFIRTLREKINRYIEMYNTSTYIDVLPDMIHNYNNSFHSGIQKIPSNVKVNDDDISNLFMEKILKASPEENKFNINDHVRYIINPRTFEKGTNAKWSKTIHIIKDKNIHSYLLDNGLTKKYYELQLVKENNAIQKPVKETSRTAIRKQNAIKRTLHREGIDLSNITKVGKTRSQETRSKRQNPKRTERFHY